MIFDIGKKKFEVIKEYRESFNEELFKEKYTEIFDKYDYIVGDLSSENLRLKGFFSGDNDKNDNHYSRIPDYLSESCAYNCAYFIVKRIKK